MKKYPLRNEYETAIRYLDTFVFDDSLKTGKAATQKNNPNLLRSYNGGKAVVYQIRTRTKTYALKCWVEDLGDLKFRYGKIDSYLKSIKLPYFVDFSYKEEGILVNGSKFPIVTMEWVEGVSLKKYISNSIQTKNTNAVLNLAEKFLEMVKTLHQNNISHGDLQHGNIMIRENGKICLVDYDTLFVPDLANEKDSVKGLPGYQHPKRNTQANLSPKSDYFSELVIYLSLLAIAENPALWESIEKEERLLFSEDDLINPEKAAIFKELALFPPKIQHLATELQKICNENNLDNLKPLEEVTNVCLDDITGQAGGASNDTQKTGEEWGIFGIDNPGNGTKKQESETGKKDSVSNGRNAKDDIANRPFDDKNNDNDWWIRAFDSGKRPHPIKYAAWGDRAGYWLEDGFTDGILLSIIAFIVVILLEMGRGNLAAQEFALLYSACLAIYLRFKVWPDWNLKHTDANLFLPTRLVDSNGKPASKKQKRIRFFAGMLSILTLGFGYLMPLWTEKKQTLHDIIAGTYVVEKR